MKIHVGLLRARRALADIQAKLDKDAQSLSVIDMTNDAHPDAVAWLLKLEALNADLMEKPNA